MNLITYETDDETTDDETDDDNELFTPNNNFSITF